MPWHAWLCTRQGVKMVVQFYGTFKLTFNAQVIFSVLCIICVVIKCVGGTLSLTQSSIIN